MAYAVASASSSARHRLDAELEELNGGGLARRSRRWERRCRPRSY